MKKIVVLLAALVPSISVLASEWSPETWFHIIDGNASKEGIAADIRAIAEAGIGGIQFFHGGWGGDVWPGVKEPIPCLSEKWVELVKFAETECHKRGLTFKMQNCPGWSMSGGPWITPDKAMRRLVAFEPGKKPKFNADDDYHEICTVTFPAPDESRDGELMRVFPNPQQINHGWAYEPKTNLWGRPCPPGAWQDSAPMTFSKPGASRLDMWEAKAGWGLRRFEMSTNAAPVKSAGTKTLVFGHVNAKRRNTPAPKEATGWECDKMSPSGFEANWAGYLGKLVKAGVKIDGTLVDSWECGCQTWTWKMEEAFEKRNGYQLRPWLPALFGYVLKSEAETEKFLLDWRNTCSRLIEENYYGTIARLARENGMSVQYETAFGDVIPGDILRYWKYADEPMCEFWSPFDNEKGFVGSHDFKPVLPCVSAAHVYGKRRVSAEALTSFALTYNENFRDWKKIIDRHYGRGVTHIVFHTYTHNPVVAGKTLVASMQGSIGSPFNRVQPWWPYMREFTRYLEFCGRELERGLPAVDILWYLGDDVNHKPSERELLFGNRYKYDYCNRDVLMTRVRAEGGRLALPDGMSYRVLWIPKGTFVLPETEKRLALLERQGARIVRGDFTPDWPSPLKAMTGRDGKGNHWYQRRDGDEDIFFIAQPDGISLFMYFRGGKLVKLVNPVDGRSRSAEEIVILKRPPADDEVPLLHAEDKPAEPWATHRESRHWFVAPEDNGRLVLSLGEVRDWATVWVNGREAARLWCEPYACDITAYVRPGRNEVRVEAVSTLRNRLIREAALPPAERKLWTPSRSLAGQPFEPAGLVGEGCRICKMKGPGAALSAECADVAKPEREKVIYVAAHPDDLGGSIGTMIRLAEKYDVHVVDYTRGERGLGEAGYRDGTTAKTRMAEEAEVCRRIGATLHWCDEIDGEASAGRATVERLASLYRELKPRALFVHWPVDTHMDHVMSAAAALDATRHADVHPEIYFHEQDIQSRGFRPDYWVNVTALADRQRELISLWKCQNGPKMAERKLQTAKTNALRIRTEWDENARYEVFSAFPGTVPVGKGIFDSMDGVLR